MMLARIYIGSRIRPLLDGNVWVQHPDTTGKSLQADAQGEQVCTIMNPKKDVRLKQASKGMANGGTAETPLHACPEAPHAHLYCLSDLLLHMHTEIPNVLPKHLLSQ